MLPHFDMKWLVFSNLTTTIILKLQDPNRTKTNCIILEKAEAVFSCYEEMQ